MKVLVFGVFFILVSGSRSNAALLLAVSSDDQQKECLIDEDRNVTVIEYTIQEEDGTRTHKVSEVSTDTISESDFTQLKKILDDSKDGKMDGEKGVLYPPMVSIVGYPTEAKNYTAASFLSYHYQGEALRDMHPSVAGGYPEFNHKTDFDRLKKILKKSCRMSRLGESSQLTKFRHFLSRW